MEIVKFVNSNEIAQKMPALHGISASTHLSAVTQTFGDSLKPFYERTAYDNRRTVHSPNLNYSLAFTEALDALLDQQYAAILNGKTTVDEAQQTIQQQGQALLDANPKK